MSRRAGRGTALLGAALAGVLLVTACSGTTTGGPDGSPSSNPAPQPVLDVLNVLPPGAATGKSQRDMYDALNRVDPSTLTDGQLGDYYKSAPLDPVTVVRTETPKSGVVIKRDAFDVPYVYGTTDEDTAWGAGYAGTEDRMFVMDAIRYSGAARISELLGPTKDNLATDAAQLRAADYSPQEAEQQLTAVAERSAQGRELLRRLDAFVAGVNAARKALCPTTDAKTCPTPYRLLGITPTAYTRADVVYAATMVGGTFGKGGGQEAKNAVFLQQLKQKMDDALARRTLADLRDATDKDTPVTDPGASPYGAPVDVDPAALALPKIGTGSQTAPGTGGAGAIPQLSGAGAGGGETVADRLNLPDAMSNAMLVSGKHTTTGRPIAVMGPQTAYQGPNFLDEIALHGPHYQARGVAFANLQFVVLIGHGRSYAWSATSASGDLVDTVYDRLCNADGSPATVRSTGYLDGDTCRSMSVADHVERAKGTGEVIARLPRMRTRHGIVQYRTTAVDGTKTVPVAVVLQRSTYMHEPDSVLGFAQMNDPQAITGPKAFVDAFSKVGYTFNWFYVDTRDIASYTSGDLPIRAEGVDPDLPRWGDAKWDWTGFLAPADHPQSIDPEQGFLVSWNNKPSSGTYSADDQWGWGPVQRVLALRDRIEASIAKGKLDRAALTADMIDAATVDVRGAYLLPDMLAVVGDDPALRQYTSLLSRWVSSGAHRVDRKRTGAYTDQNAIALMDVWYPLVAKQVLEPRLGSLVDQVPTDLDNAPSAKHRGSAWNNVGAYSWVARDLRAQLGRPVGSKMSQGYCGKGVLADCRTELRQTLQDAVATLTREQKTADPAKWTYDKSQDDIQFQFVGETVKPLEWQNRPTFQQVVG